MTDLTLLPSMLWQHEGEGEAAEEAASQDGNEAPVYVRRNAKKGAELSNVVYGEDGDPAEEAPKQEPKKETETTVTVSTEEDRKSKFKALMSEYKDLYTEQFNSEWNRRHKAAKEVEERLEAQSPVIDTLMQKYGIKGNDTKKLMDAINSDTQFWEDMAESAGMDVPHYQEYLRMQRENEVLRQTEEQQRARQYANQQVMEWQQQAEQLKQAYPSFDLGAETQNPQFVAMLKSGVPVEQAYKVMHMDELMASQSAAIAEQTEKQVVDNIRAKGMRPSENGMSAQAPFVRKPSVSELTKADRAEIARRAARGEVIRFTR